MNLPASFEARMQQTLGTEFVPFTEALTSTPPVSIRLNPAKMQALPALERVPWSEFGFYLPSRPSFTLDPFIHAGAYYVQEASSMFLEQALRQHLDLAEPLRVLDLCGAPGGKSTHLASLLSPDSLLVSNEVIRQRANILAENLQKWGSGNVIVTNNDPRDFQRLPDFFDVMVVDAPCSGEGMFRKDPAAIGEWSEANVKLCAERQRRILMDVWDALKPGGLLVYSTCTYNLEENELNLAWLAEQHELEVLPLAIPAEWHVSVSPDPKLPGYHFYPHLVKGEGFFLAVVRKGGEAAEWQPKKTKKPLLAPAPKASKALVENWLLQPENWEILQQNEMLFALPAEHLAAAEAVYQHLRVVYGGIELAELKKKNLKPLPALALSQHLNLAAFPVTDADLASALRFLHKDDISLSSGREGWNLLAYQGLPLGWLKKLQNRANNNFPSEWRIRMNIEQALPTLAPQDFPLASVAF